MKKKKHEGYESVKLDREVVKKVREDKEKTGVPINVFFKIAAEEKLKKDKK